MTREYTRRIASSRGRVNNVISSFLLSVNGDYNERVPLRERESPRARALTEFFVRGVVDRELSRRRSWLTIPELLQVSFFLSFFLLSFFLSCLLLKASVAEVSWLIVADVLEKWNNVRAWFCGWIMLAFSLSLSFSSFISLWETRSPFPIFSIEGWNSWIQFSLLLC